MQKQKLLPLIVLSLVALAFSEPAAAQAQMERDKAKSGTGASTEGGASLGGTGIDSGVANPRGVDETDKRLRIERKPKKDPEEKPDRRSPAAKDAATDAAKDASSAGATKPRGTLSDEADKQDQEFSKKRRP